MHDESMMMLFGENSAVHLATKRRVKTMGLGNSTRVQSSIHIPNRWITRIDPLGVRPMVVVALVVVKLAIGPGSIDQVSRLESFPSSSKRSTAKDLVL